MLFAQTENHWLKLMNMTCQNIGLFLSIFLSKDKNYDKKFKN